MTATRAVPGMGSLYSDCSRFPGGEQIFCLDSYVAQDPILAANILKGPGLFVRQRARCEGDGGDRTRETQRPGWLLPSRPSTPRAGPCSADKRNSDINGRCRAEARGYHGFPMAEGQAGEAPFPSSPRSRAWTSSSPLEWILLARGYPKSVTSNLGVKVCRFGCTRPGVVGSREGGGEWMRGRSKLKGFDAGGRGFQV